MTLRKRICDFLMLCQDLIYITKKRRKIHKKIGGHKPNPINSHKCAGQPKRAL